MPGNTKYADLTPEQKKSVSAASMSWRARNPERFKAYMDEYRKTHPEKVRQWNQKQYYKNHEAHLEYHNDYRERLKLEVIAAYGGCCECCGENEPTFLTIDHVHGYSKRPDLYTHSKRQRGSAPLYMWLRKNGFPKEGFALLCFNCNLGKSANSRKSSDCIHTSFDPMRLVSSC